MAERKRLGAKKPRTNISKRWKTAIILGVLLLPIIVGSWSTEVIADTTSNAALSSASQYSVYNATLWMAQYSRPNATFLCLTDWRFTYSNTTVGRDSVLHFFSDPQPAEAYAKQVGAIYIIVTFVVTIPLPNTANIYPWNNFRPSTNLTLAYSNSDVKIFKIT